MFRGEKGKSGMHILMLSMILHFNITINYMLSVGYTQKSHMQT